MQDEEEGEVRRKINTIGQRINPWKKERILLGVEREEFDWIRFSKLNSRCPVKFKLQVNNEQVFSIKYVLYNIWLEKEMAEYSRILAWEIPRTEEPGRLQSMGLQRSGHDWGLTAWHTIFDRLSVCYFYWCKYHLNIYVMQYFGLIYPKLCFLIYLKFR